MLIFHYDKSFEGLLSAVFDAYSEKIFPEKLIGDGEPEPMFTRQVWHVITDPYKSNRVWKGLQKKMVPKAANMLFHAWLSEQPGCDELIFRYIRKIFDSPLRGMESNFADPDILSLHKLAMQVSKESHCVRQFVRFQKAGDNTFFGPISPKFNCLPLTLGYFRDRFADQKWIVYDIKRKYGFYYDLHKVVEINLPTDPMDGALLNDKLMAEDEKLFQQLWNGYFKALAIQERINPKVQRQHMPRRFWKYLPEMQ